MKLKHDLEVTWGPCHTPLSTYRTLVPKGTICIPIPEGATAQTHCWVKHASVLVPDWDLMQKHDAFYYGISIPLEDVEP